MDESTTTVHVTSVLTSSRIVDLIEEYPNLTEITCSPSVYKRTSKKYIEALEQLDIEVKKRYNWGAKSRTNGAEDFVLRLAKEGLKQKKKKKKMGITLNRVYYLLNKTNEKFDNRNRKHDHSKVKSLKEEGLSAKEISEKLDIPLRTVYNILNKK